MLKLTRHVFDWTADPRCADYYERALWNGILGTQHPDDGMTVYYVPLASGYWKLFGRPTEAFWCCTGTGLESFAKLADSVYFHDDDGRLREPLRALHPRLARARGDPRAGDALPRGGDHAPRRAHEGAAALRPSRPRALVGQERERPPERPGPGRPSLRRAATSSWIATFRDGDRLELTLPMTLRACPMPDDPSLVAAVHGPIVLAGRLGTEGLTPDTLRAEPTKPRMVPEYKSDPRPARAHPHRLDGSQGLAPPRPGRSLEYETTGQDHALRLSPLYR